MNHLAIDLGGRKSQVCICGPDGTRLLERSVVTRDLQAFFGGQPPSRVVMETCAESRTVAGWAKGAGHEVRVIHAASARVLGVGARGIKTDIRDARALASASCKVDLVGVHVRSTQARDYQAVIGLRAGLVATRTQLINQVLGIFRAELIAVGPKTSRTFVARLSPLLEKLPELARVAVQGQLDVIGKMNEAISKADAQIRALADADATCARLMTVPGVGPLTALCTVAVTDGSERFRSAKAFTSYIGITPGESSSSGRVQRTSITKAGSPLLRSYLTQAAWCIWRTCANEPIMRWARAIADRRGTKIAITALMRKLAGVLFAIMRDGSVYESERTIAGA
jgi:transposase